MRVTSLMKRPDGLSRTAALSPIRYQQDKLDAATIYSMLENEIVPLYFEKTQRVIRPSGSSISRVRSDISLLTSP